MALLGAACGEAPPRPTVSEGAAGTAAAGGEVECHGVVYDPAALEAAPPASSLPDGPLDALDDGGEPAFDPAENWRVVHETAFRVDLVRELDEPIDQGGGDIRTHEVRSLEVITGATNVPDGTWMLTLAGPCAQRAVGGSDVGEADLMLAKPADPDATTLALLVTERACASGRSADGRVELLALEETGTEIRLRIGVRPLPGDQNCPGNPPTPFDVDLRGPVGDRAILDVGVEPPREITLDPAATPWSEPDATEPSCEQIERFAARLVDIGITYDYEPSDGPADLAAHSDVVFRGHLTGEVVDVPMTSPAGDAYVGYEIAVDDVLAGEAALVGDTATVAMAYNPAEADVDDYARTVVAGVPVLVFAYQQPDAPGGLRAAVMEGFLTACGDGPLLGWVSNYRAWAEVTSLDVVAEIVRATR
jgi:hypothetical protein